MREDGYSDGLVTDILSIWYIEAGTQSLIDVVTVRCISCINIFSFALTLIDVMSGECNNRKSDGFLILSFPEDSDSVLS